MAQQRAPGFRIDARAWHAWEQHAYPLRLEEVVQRLFELPDGRIRLVQLGPIVGLWQLTGELDGGRFHLVGARGRGGAWLRVHFVTPPPLGLG